MPFRRPLGVVALRLHLRLQRPIRCDRVGSTHSNPAPRVVWQAKVQKDSRKAEVSATLRKANAVKVRCIWALSQDSRPRIWVAEAQDNGISQDRRPHILVSAVGIIASGAGLLGAQNAYLRRGPLCALFLGARTDDRSSHTYQRNLFCQGWQREDCSIGCRFDLPQGGASGQLSRRSIKCCNL